MLGTGSSVWSTSKSRPELAESLRVQQAASAKLSLYLYKLPPLRESATGAVKRNSTSYAPEPATVGGGYFPPPLLPQREEGKVCVWETRRC